RAGDEPGKCVVPSEHVTCPPSVPRGSGDTTGRTLAIRQGQQITPFGFRHDHEVVGSVDLGAAGLIEPDGVAFPRLRSRWTDVTNYRAVPIPSHPIVASWVKLNSGSYADAAHLSALLCAVATSWTRDNDNATAQLAYALRWVTCGNTRERISDQTVK